MNKDHMLLFAALCGALVSLQVENSLVYKTTIQKLCYVMCGVAVAFFVTPLITSYWQINDSGQISAIGFLIALGWQNLYERFTRGIDETSLPFQNNCSCDIKEQQSNNNDKEPL